MLGRVDIVDCCGDMSMALAQTNPFFGMKEQEPEIGAGCTKMKEAALSRYLGQMET